MDLNVEIEYKQCLVWCTMFICFYGLYVSWLQIERRMLTTEIIKRLVACFKHKILYCVALQFKGELPIALNKGADKDMNKNLIHTAPPSRKLNISQCCRINHSINRMSKKKWNVLTCLGALKLHYLESVVL